MCFFVDVAFQLNNSCRDRTVTALFLQSFQAGENALRLVSVSDNLLKGAAGTAVHCMNLLFGLSERTGLALKSSAI